MPENRVWLRRRLSASALGLIISLVPPALTACGDSGSSPFDPSFLDGLPPSNPDEAGLTPRIERVEPPLALRYGGSRVSIFGRGFASRATVSIGGLPLENLEFRSGTLITGKLPRKGPGFFGPIEVSVQNPSGAVDTRSDLLRYFLSPFPFRNMTLLPTLGTPALGGIAADAGDLNRDGRADIAVLGSLGVTQFLSNDWGGFDSSHIAVVGKGPRDLVVGDVTEDGVFDVVVANSLSRSVSVLQNDGAGTLSRRDFSVGQAPTAVALLDLNQDGRTDIATRDDTGAVKVLLRDGAGNFSAAIDANLSSTLFQRSRLADLNGI